MRHHRLFAAGLAAALMLGAASPALAAGKAKGKPNHGTTKQKPNKPAKKPQKAKKNGGASGGGSITGGSFSINARTRHLKNAHFNYTSDGETSSLRCKNFSAVGVYSITVPTVTLANATCSWTTVVNLVPTTQEVLVDATFTDNGQPKSATKDSIGFTVKNKTDYSVLFTVTGADGNLTGGNIKVRP